MKKVISIVLAVLLLLAVVPAHAMSRADYDLYYEIVDFLCADWESPYDDLIDELAYEYGVSPYDILDFIDEATGADRDHVWIPVNGGKKYHVKPTCSNMIEPRPCTRSLAKRYGFGACGRCNP